MSFRISGFLFGMVAFSFLSGCAQDPESRRTAAKGGDGENFVKIAADIDSGESPSGLRLKTDKVLSITTVPLKCFNGTKQEKVFDLPVGKDLTKAGLQALLADYVIDCQVGVLTKMTDSKGQSVAIAVDESGRRVVKAEEETHILTSEVKDSKGIDKTDIIASKSIEINYKTQLSRSETSANAIPVIVIGDSMGKPVGTTEYTFESPDISISKMSAEIESSSTISLSVTFKCANAKEDGQFLSYYIIPQGEQLIEVFGKEHIEVQWPKGIVLEKDEAGTTVRIPGIQNTLKQGTIVFRFSPLKGTKSAKANDLMSFNFDLRSNR